MFNRFCQVVFGGERPQALCLVVDGNRVKDVYERSVQGRAEYEDLLRTAANKVGKRD